MLSTSLPHSDVLASPTAATCDDAGYEGEGEGGGMREKVCGENGDWNGSLRERQSPAREVRNSRHKEVEQSARLSFCTRTQVSHTAEEKELKGTGNTQGEGRQRGSAGRIASCDLS